MILSYVLSALVTTAASLPQHDTIEKDFKKLSSGFDGRAGLCAIVDLKAPPACVNGQTPYPLQSVMKLIVSAAVFDAIDAGKLKLTDTILVKPSDRSPGPREFYEFVKEKGSHRATIEELVRRSLVDSDSTAVDLLIKKLGGIATVQAFLSKNNVEGVRIDRDERTLQAEFYGLKWEDRFADPQVFEAAIQAVPPAARQKALAAYRADPRDTATPEGMAIFLKRLFTSRMLKKESKETLLAITEKTATGSNRLRAGIPKGWTLGHRTGTSAAYEGETATTNDVGVITTPEGHMLPVAVFLADSKWSDERRAQLMAEAARIVTRPSAKP